MSGYSLQPWFFAHEDILICLDVDPIMDEKAELTSFGDRVVWNIDCILMALSFFVQANLSINADHRFAFCTLSQSSISWVQRELSSELDSVLHAIDDISPDSYSQSQEHADHTQLFQIPAVEATRCITESRILRLCRSCVPPEHHWPVDQNLFTLDVVFLHEDRDVERCWNNVHGALVDAIGDISISGVLSDPHWCEERNRFHLDVVYLLEDLNVGYCRNNVYGALVVVVGDISKHEGYVIRCLHGLFYALLRHMCVLLLHPQQRCAQDEIDIPKSLAKKLTYT